jgi:ATP adenylyltransferase
MAYLRDLKHKVDDVGRDSAGTGDFLAQYFAAPPERDRDNLVVFRSAHGLIVLNRYPYANGHLMAALGEARPRLLDYAPAQRAELWKLVEIAMDAMQRALEPQGVNLGLNEGKAAGAGLPEHLHAHIIPRWAGDTNFITVVGHVRVIPSALEAMWDLYRETFATMK